MVFKFDIKEFERNRVTTVVIAPELYGETRDEILRSVIGLGKPVTIIAMNTAPEDIEAIASGCKKQGHIAVVDTTSAVIGGVTESGAELPCISKVYRVSNPARLDDLSFSIKKALEESKAKLLVFDSLTTLLIYNEERAVMLFANRLGTLLKSRKVTSMLFLVKQDFSSEVAKALAVVSKIKDVK